MSRIWIVAGVLMAIAACDSPKPPSTPASTPPPSAITEGPKAVAEAPKPADPAPAAPSPTPQDPGPGQPPPTREDLYPAKNEYVVKPLEGEPVWPGAADEKEIAKRGFLPFKGGYQYELRDSAGKVAQSGAVVDGRILLTHGLIELLGCGEGGKEYESVLRLEADIQGLDLALQLSGLKRGPVPARLNDPSLNQGSRVVVLLQWEDEGGRTITHRAEDCVVNIHRQKPMPRVGWTYVGALLSLPDPGAPSGRSFRVLAATGTRSLLTTYRDSTTLLDNPIEDAVDDTLYVANYMVLPKVGTQVRVILRGPDERGRQEIAAAEKELEK
ncbi:MAG TPA: YdjY domain-containing protein [Planctomycetota bacterium]|jgi:hypothetical protein